VNAAETPLKATAVTVAKLDPCTVTTVPAGPLGGANDAIDGGVSTVKLPVLVSRTVQGW